MFTGEVCQKLGYYVYRLIDPRNGETFYVGKGKDSRVFAHARGELTVSDDALTEKLLRIKKIKNSGFEVAHVIHRHGLSEEQAFEVEAALIDAYPEVTNFVGGRESDERGLMHANQIMERYAAPIAEFNHKCILITINRSIEERESIYGAVNYAWKIDPKKAKKADFVLAVQQGLIVGVFVAKDWLPATTANFPGTTNDREGRWGFHGTDAPPEAQEKYLRHRLPPGTKKRGAANPVHYVGWN